MKPQRSSRFALAPARYWAWPRAAWKPRLRGVFGVVIATLVYCARHAGPLFVIAWFPCLLESASRLALEWLAFSYPPRMPAWLFSRDFEPPSWLTAFVVTPWAAIAWAIVLSDMAQRALRRDSIVPPTTWIDRLRLAARPAILIAAAIFSATNLVDGMLRLAERKLLALMDSLHRMSDIDFAIWGFAIIAVHMVAMAAVMAASYPPAGYVLRTGALHAGTAWRILRGNILRFTAIFFLLTVVLAGLDQLLAPVKVWLVSLFAPSGNARSWTLQQATIRYLLDFPLSMLIIVAWAVVVGILLDGRTERAPSTVPDQA